MIQTSRSERRWFLNNLAQGLADYLGTMEPPVPVEDLLRNPPPVYEADFGVVEMHSTLWDATFARPPSRKGSVFVQVDLESEQRRYALARETLSAVITSKHGRASGLFDLLLPHLQESGEYFARAFLAPDRLVRAYWKNGCGAPGLAEAFDMPLNLAEERLEEIGAET
jgi:hypothetical protein